MKQLLFTIPAILVATAQIFSQTSPGTEGHGSATTDKKFYFPVSYYSDSIALNKAIPVLAEQITEIYKEPVKRTYFENSINYYVLSENYEKTIGLVDSIQKMDDDNSYGIEMKSYALAKTSDKKEQGSFEKVFKKEFLDAFNLLSFRKKVNIALLNSSDLDYFDTDYISIKEKLQKNNKDSLTLEDARSLCDKFFYFSFYKKIISLISPMIDARYKPTFPAIKAVKWAGVAPVQGIQEFPDPGMTYKLLFELTGFAYKGQDSAAKKEINDGLGTVARELNLHEAAGILRKNINTVIVVHGSAMNVFLTNEKYKKKYGIDNPNIPLIKELLDYGVKIIACGQLMTYTKLEAEDLVPGIKQALSAQTVLSTYQLKNYVHFDLSLTDQ